MSSRGVKGLYMVTFRELSTTTEFIELSEEGKKCQKGL